MLAIASLAKPFAVLGQEEIAVITASHGLQEEEAFQISSLARKLS